MEYAEPPRMDFGLREAGVSSSNTVESDLLRLFGHLHSEKDFVRAGCCCEEAELSSACFCGGVCQCHADIVEMGGDAEASRLRLVNGPGHTCPTQRLSGRFPIVDRLRGAGTRARIASSFSRRIWLRGATTM